MRKIACLEKAPAAIRPPFPSLVQKLGRIILPLQGAPTGAFCSPGRLAGWRDQGCIYKKSGLPHFTRIGLPQPIPNQANGIVSRMGLGCRDAAAGSHGVPLLAARPPHQ